MKTSFAQSLVFPTLDEEPIEESAELWQWPTPQPCWRDQTWFGTGCAQPCRLESHNGAAVDGHVLEFEPKSASLIFGSPSTGPAARLSFSRFRRLTLTTPLLPAPLRPGAAAGAVPAAVREHDYRLDSPRPGQQPLTGRTLGHVETVEGLFLFAPVENASGVLRVFVPRSSYGESHFTLSVREIAAQRRITTPHELLAAIEQQQRMPVRRIGQSLLDLGLLTPDQLTRALARGTESAPLGEQLVAEGAITRSDLRTALAHKMGYPLVDLSRFPPDPAAVELLSLNLALRYRAVALMKDKQRLIIAVDRPQRVVKLQSLSRLSGFELVPVLASKAEIMLALARMTEQDPWAHNVHAQPLFFATTV